MAVTLQTWEEVVAQGDNVGTQVTETTVGRGIIQGRDTQCGAKLFRNSPELAALFDEPFISRWIFDVEIIARLIRAHRTSDRRPPEEVIFECPLMEWYEIRGSKLRLRDFFLMSLDLFKIIRHYAPLRGR